MIKVSVVIPVYNVEQYLKDCLDSILRQTINTEFVEVVLVNDGSTDGSENLCRDFQKQFANCKLINQKNQGPSVARNRGLKEAIGEYVQFVDADDWIAENTLEVAVSKMDTGALELLCYDAEMINESSVFESVNIYDRKGIVKENLVMSGKTYLEKYMGRGKYYVQPGLCMYRRKFLMQNEIVFPENHFFEDEIFSLDVYLHAKKVLYVPEKFYVRRYRDNSTMTTTVSKKKVADKIWITGKVAEIIKQNKKYISVKLFNVLKVYWSKLANVCMNMIDCMEENAEERDVLKRKHIKEIIRVSRELSKEKTVSDIRYLLKYLEDAREFMMKDKAYAQELLREVLYDEFYSVYIFKLYLHNEMSIKYKKIFEELELSDENKVVGIYGLGEHTKKMLQVYRLYMGDIKAQVMFVDSKKESFSEPFMGRDVVNIRDAAKYVDTVIISSRLYEEEMLAMAEELLGERVHIHTLYREEAESLF